MNLIAGENNVGKTALLEALWQFSGADQPDIGLRIGQFRGIHQISPGELLFDLFHRFDVSEPIELTATGDWGANHQTLQIETRARENSRIPIPGNDQAGKLMRVVAESPHEIVLRYTDGTDERESCGWFTARATGPGTVEGGFETRQDQLPGRPSSHYFAPRLGNFFQQDAERLGRLKVLGLEDLVIKALKPFDPSLCRLTTIPLDGNSVIHADVGVGRLIPIGLLGEGIQRVLSVALAFESAASGMILVDETENGVHHSKLRDLWRAISSFSKEFDVQVFATTHSGECVRAAHQTFLVDGYDFGFLSWIESTGRSISKP